LPFVERIDQSWEGDFWYASELMLATMGREIEDWIGAKDAEVSRQVLKQAQELKKSAVNTKLTEHQLEFSAKFISKGAQEKAIKDSESLDPFSHSKAFKFLVDGFWRASCPACSAMGAAGGDHVETAIADDQEGMDYGWERTEKIYQTDEFICPTCGLHLIGDDEIHYAEMDGTHIEESEQEVAWEPDYGND
jgi:hypothetical protein